ncbi:MAG: hypothetical protein E6R03_13610 [Hyphomicrobiaceae bacterium]|nr:MAG: hypothetical protein E6R03_13610 [Hyphomicrobiaceae bacterium]
MSDDHSANDIATLINNARELAGDDVNGNAVSKPILIVDTVNPDQTVDDLAQVLRQTAVIYDRGMPCVVVRDAIQDCLIASPLTPASLTALAHKHARPRKVRGGSSQGDLVDVRLPKDISSMYLDSRALWQLPPLNGFSSSPMMSDDGEIRSASGYDVPTGLWLVNVPDLSCIVPLRPSRDQAEAALRRLRARLATFCFADAETIKPNDARPTSVNLDRPPGADESAALCALMTAVARPSLDTAPAILVRSAAISGAGTGKGLLCRVISSIAYGRKISAVTIGETSQEFEKRLSAELMSGHPVVFLDNVNNRSVRSNLLAAAITESPARVRKLGTSEMIAINNRCLILITGNGVTVAEDLVRRTLLVELDARNAAPESRTFTDDILKDTAEQRDELLAAVLTIWRWSRQDELPKGVSAGSFHTWARWCRDPLLALGCRDPILRQREMKEIDPEREHLTRAFEQWAAAHGDAPMTADALHESVKEALIPGRASRQALAAYLVQIAGIRIDGWYLQRLPRQSKWPGNRYRLIAQPDRNAPISREL